MEDIIANSLELFSGKCRNFVAVVYFLVLPECMDSFYTLYILNYRTYKSYTNHFVRLELVLLESGRNFLRNFVADSCLGTEWYKSYRQPPRCNNNGLLIIPVSSTCFGNLIFVVLCLMLYNCEISPTRCNNCVLFFAMAFLYMFRETILPIIRSTYAVYDHR